MSPFFSCIRKDLCGAPNSGVVIRDGIIAFEDRLLQLVAEAELSVCGSDDQVCCHEDNVLPDPDNVDEEEDDYGQSSDIPNYS